MSCRPMFCEGRADCGDKHCPGHPRNSDEEAIRRIQEAELRWQCASSGQMSAAQIVAHARAGDFAMGEEAADPANREPVKVARDPLPVSFAGPEPFDWQALVLWIAVAVAFTSVVALSIADPRDLSTLWPRLTAALSF